MTLDFWQAQVRNPKLEGLSHVVVLVVSRCAFFLFLLPDGGSLDVLPAASVLSGPTRETRTSIYAQQHPSV